MSELLGEHKRCSVCREWGWFGGRYDQHTCKPTWEWQVESWHGTETWDELHAYDAEAAAVRAAERYDESDHPLLDMHGRGEVEIKIRNPRTGEVTHWIGRAELVPHYHATPTPAPVCSQQGREADHG